MGKRKLNGAVVVITGASSGIGRATALGFAGKKARLVLAARDEEGLADIAAECNAAGGQAITLSTDVTNPAAVRYLAEHAAEMFGGRIDVWVNNAGVGAVGDFIDTPIDVHDQVVRTNLLGYMHGAHAVLPYFRQRREGVLINNVSFGAWFPAPYAVAYSASKHGLKGFSDALRGELSHWPEIRVCDVFPSFVNTPAISDHAANYSGHELFSTETAMDPHTVADAIVGAAQQPRDEVTVGVLASAARVANTVSPRLSRWAAGRATEALLRSTGRAPTTAGTLFEPQDGGRIHGYDPALRRNVQLAATAGGVLVVLGLLAYQLSRSGLLHRQPRTHG